MRLLLPLLQLRLFVSEVEAPNEQSARFSREDISYKGADNRKTISKAHTILTIKKEKFPWRLLYGGPSVRRPPTSKVAVGSPCEGSLSIRREPYS